MLVRVSNFLVPFGIAAIFAALPVVAGPPALDAAIAAHYQHNPPPSYEYSLVDLNGDEVLDAAILINDPDYCGTGGCSMAIMRGVGQSYSYVSGSSITRTPIRVLTESRHGWRSLSVSVAGGGAKPGEVVMRFDGERYPLNPTMQPYATPEELAGAEELHLGK